MSNKEKWDGETCKRCGRPYRIGFEVLDEIWEKVTSGDSRTLCLDCFDALAKRLGISYEATLFWSGYGIVFTDKERETQAELNLTHAVLAQAQAENEALKQRVKELEDAWKAFEIWVTNRINFPDLSFKAHRRLARTVIMFGDKLKARAAECPPKGAGRKEET